jgi:hypothetical protein
VMGEESKNSGQARTLNLCSCHHDWKPGNCP